MRPICDPLALRDGREQGAHVIAVHALRVPAERMPLILHRLDRHDFARRTVGLLVVAVDESEEVVEPVMRPGHGSFPGRALLQFAVGKQIEHAGVAPVQLQSEGHADRLRQAVTERAAGHLEAGCELAS